MDKIEDNLIRLLCAMSIFERLAYKDGEGIDKLVDEYADELKDILILIQGQAQDLYDLILERQTIEEKEETNKHEKS